MGMSGSTITQKSTAKIPMPRLAPTALAVGLLSVALIFFRFAACVSFGFTVSFVLMLSNLVCNCLFKIAGIERDKL